MISILLIDNYDSFVYNIAQYLQSLGAKVEVVRNDSPYIDTLLQSVDGVVISPGPGHPRNSNRSLDLASGEHGLPVLGICLGHQAIAYVHGAKVERNHTVVHGKQGMIIHDGQDLMSGVPNPLLATRYHSLIVSPEGLPDCIAVTARTKEGEIMAIRIKGKDLYGLQFHPESVMTVAGRTILSNFLGVCR
ncbi:MAG: hypothetical protein PWQ88_901 [Candidatus Methanomethylophilaceae archaeon]|nr:hypothetical protein [Candidatus Methanomethylophilaceae archaeon]MDI3541971.1 hypothetical protein [Candidatus Methanomethylophilaceae archaeon]HIJ00831.1 aminodeoxychorismate/anthranilate synthase component II [Candidatus Methanomethylophilaceae archaeon]